MLVLVTTLFTITSTRPIVAQSEPLTLTLDAGYDGVFRDQQWMPVVIQARNNGLPVRGRLIVRPETSGSGITNTYSTPITLPRNGELELEHFVPVNRKVARWWPSHTIYYMGKVREAETPHNSKPGDLS